MSAFSGILASSRQKSSGVQPVLSPSTKARSRYELLSGRHKNSMQGDKGAASFWKYFKPVLTEDPETDKAVSVQLQCLLCNKLLSATNESRIAATHLKAGACSALKKDDELAEEVARLLHMPSKQLPADDDEDDSAARHAAWDLS